MNYHLFIPEEFEDLFAVEEVCFEPPHRFGRTYMRQLVGWPDAATWIAAENDSIIGFAIVEWASEVAGIVAYIQTIEVLPEERGRGIGRELLRRIEGSANAAGAIDIWLHVNADNVRAIALYQGSGYKYAGRKEHYYGRGKAAEIYIKNLKPVE
jgi:ribosomal-protein-alanine N-acetyltransferase